MDIDLLILSKNEKNKELKRIDPSIIKNIVKLIHENGSMKKTPLMERTKLDYPRLNSYLKWLELIDFVSITDQNVTLTENGLKFNSRYLK